MITSLALLTLQTVAESIKVVSSSPELFAALATAQPGATIQLAPGTYKGGQVSNLHGTAARPIKIVAQVPKSPPVFTSGLQFSSISYVNLTGITVEDATTNGLNIDDGGTITSPSHHVILTNIVVRRLPSGNHDGIKLSGLDDFEVNDCTLKNWGGSGIDMVGCHRGKISNCTLKNGGDSGIQAKGGSADIVVDNCKFGNFGQRGVNIGGSTGMQFFRPSVASMPPNGKYEAKDITVRNCTFFRGGAPIAFVGVDGAKVEHNTFYRPGKWVLRILQETTAPGFVQSRKGVFQDNTIAFRSDEWSAGGIIIGGGTAPETFSFARNTWFCLDKPGLSRPNLPTPELNGTYGKDPGFIDPEAGDFRRKPGS